VNDAAGAVDRLAVVAGHEPLPGPPAAALGERQHDRVAEARGDDVVGVEEQQQAAAGHGGTGIAGRPEPAVVVAGDHPCGRGELGDDGERLVGGGIVGDDQLVLGPQLGDDRRQRPPQRRRGVVGDDDDREGQIICGCGSSFQGVDLRSRCMS
jgi:hypothetical protein